jgi:hypothetical protein
MYTFPLKTNLSLRLDDDIDTYCGTICVYILHVERDFLEINISCLIQ